jgi:hypothetical protein
MVNLIKTQQTVTVYIFNYFLNYSNSYSYPELSFLHLHRYLKCKFSFKMFIFYEFKSYNEF